MIGGGAGAGPEAARRARAEGASVILTGANPGRLERQREPGARYAVRPPRPATRAGTAVWARPGPAAGRSPRPRHRARAGQPLLKGLVMTVRRISFGPGLPAGFPFSLASEHNGVLHISGMPSLDAEGKSAPGTLEQEADRARANTTAIGYTSDEFLYGQVLLADIGTCGDINDWWRRQFPDPAAAPSRLTFQAGALPFGAKIELQAVAAHDRSADRRLHLW